MGYGKVLASSAQRLNLAEPEGGYPTVALEALAGQMLSVNPAFVGAMGAKNAFTSGNDGWLDYLGTGGRIRQDAVTPGVPKLGLAYADTKVTQPENINYSGTSQQMAESIQSNLATIYEALNNLLNREATRDAYLQNYKFMRTWSESGGEE